MIAAVSAVLLFIVMFFGWFGVDVPDDAAGFVAAAGVDTTANAWQAFTWIDLIMLVTILVAIGGAVMTASSQSINTPVAISALTTVLGGLSLLLVLFRIIDPPGPDGITREIGLWLGLILTAGITYGGFTAMQEEGTSFSGERDRVQSR
jgi:hypothetical protein